MSKLFIVTMYYFIPGLLTFLLSENVKKNSGIWFVKSIGKIEVYNLILSASGYFIAMLIYGQQMDFNLAQPEQFTYAKWAFFFLTWSLGLGLGSLLGIKKKKESIKVIIGMLTAVIFFLGGPVILTIYQDEMRDHIKIIEVCSDNFSIVEDAGGYYADYIKIYNPAFVEVPLEKMYLSDSKKNLSKYEFPNRMIPARTEIMIFASGDHQYNLTEEMRTEWEQEYHTNFKISSKGETIILSNESEEMIDKVKVPSMKYNQIYVMKNKRTDLWSIEDVSLVKEANDEKDFMESVSLPKVILEGNVDRISKDTSAHVTIQYKDAEQEFAGYAKIQLQGSSTASNKRKTNYNIKLYKDSALEEVMPVKFLDWGEQYKYCIKGNVTDSSQSKNIVTSRIWGEMVQSRANVEDKLLQLENGGAVDGFPIVVFLNGEYLGLYTMNIPKSTWLFGMGNGEKEAFFATKTHEESVCFYKTIDYDTELDVNWDLKYCSTEDETWAKNRMNEFISFVINYDGEEFKKEIGQYLDIDAAIDYMILMYLSGAGDNMEKNICWITYEGSVWIPSMYDLDHTWQFYVTPLIPTIENGKIEANASNLLWQKLLENYPQETAKRYFTLRSTILNESHIMQKFDEFIRQVPANIYSDTYQNRRDDDYQNITDAMKSMDLYMQERFVIFDKFFDEIVER